MTWCHYGIILAANRQSKSPMLGGLLKADAVRQRVMERTCRRVQGATDWWFGGEREGCLDATCLTTRRKEGMKGRMGGGGKCRVA